MSDNQGLSDSAWATWANNVVANHGSTLAAITGSNINSVAFSSTSAGALLAGFNSAVWGTDFSNGSQQAIADRQLGNGMLNTQLLNIKQTRTNP